VSHCDRCDRLFDFVSDGGSHLPHSGQLRNARKFRLCGEQTLLRVLAFRDIDHRSDKHFRPRLRSSRHRGLGPYHLAVLTTILPFDRVMIDFPFSELSEPVVGGTTLLADGQV
jgi:hypothetical protein